MASELLILSLDLVKDRVVVMTIEMRKSFIGQILVGLIEKTPQECVDKFPQRIKAVNPTALKKAKTREFWPFLVQWGTVKTGMTNYVTSFLYI